ncbi:MAG: TetR/AcrR family transcriptional regulator [bacterium]|nr:TetR/AcrR family transcriptional regulator [bacterium]
MSQRRGRRAAGEVRQLILATARERLAKGGPEAIRLEEIARDVGISRPSILHHFGSRDGLTQALAQDAQDRLNADVLAALSVPADESTIGPLVRRVFEALGDSGHARLLAWRGLAMGEPRPEDTEQQMLRSLTDAIHARRVEYARIHQQLVPTREESAFLVRLLGAALVGDSIVGPVFELRAELDGQPDSHERFRSWLSALITNRFAGGDVGKSTGDEER